MRDFVWNILISISNQIEKGGLKFKPNQHKKHTNTNQEGYIREIILN